MESIKDVSRQVKEILTNDKASRNSDDRLYYLVCKEMLAKRGVDIYKITFASALLHRKEHCIPPFETVRRTRQKVQRNFPELRGSADVEAMRAVKEEVFREYAKGVNV